MNDQLVQALEIGNVELAQHALAQANADINARNNAGMSALMVACEKGHWQLVELFLNSGAADINAFDDGGSWNALMLACDWGYSQCVELLIKSKADVNAQAEQGWNALMFACQNGHSPCVELLIKSKADLNTQAEQGWSALMFACHKGHSQCMELLINSSADVNARQQDGWDALMEACYRSQWKCAEQLLLNDANVDAEGDEGETALWLACQRCNLKTIHLLLEAKADPHQSQKSAMHAVFGINQEPVPDGDEDAQIPDSMPRQRSMAAFLLMCNGYGLARENQSYVADVSRDYQRIHALVEQRHQRLMVVSSKEVKTDGRFGLEDNGLYHEPLERVIEYSGMHLTPQVLNKYEDAGKDRVLMTESFEAMKMAFDEFQARLCQLCRAVGMQPCVQRCSCDAVVYCSCECQANDWVRHKPEHDNILE